LCLNSSEGIDKKKEYVANFGKENSYKARTRKIRRREGDIGWIIEKLILRLRGACN
jgi:hypothetical protein